MEQNLKKKDGESKGNGTRRKNQRGNCARGGAVEDLDDAQRLGARLETTSNEEAGRSREGKQEHRTENEKQKHKKQRGRSMCSGRQDRAIPTTTSKQSRIREQRSHNEEMPGSHTINEEERGGNEGFWVLHLRPGVGEEWGKGGAVR